MALRGLVLAGLLALPWPAAAQQSNAARYLLEQEIAMACGSPGGQAEPGALIERDLTGDGRSDLIISHEGVLCSGGLNTLCGASACRVAVFVREGDLLVPKAEMLGAGIRLGPEDPPVITGYGQGGHAWTLRWDGETFR